MASKRILFTLLILVFAPTVIAFFNACSIGPSEDSKGGSFFQAQSQFYFKQMTRLKVQVVYETGAEPYVGSTPGGRAYWDFLEENLVSVFQGRNVVFNIPKNLAEMTEIASSNKAVWTGGDATSLASQHQTPNTDAATGLFFVAFVNGYAADANGNPDHNIIGFQVSGTTTILIFKDVIKNTGGSLAIVPRYVEQSTLIHEMGHALGFVNNGLPMRAGHQDTAHGAHCTNSNCVMYHLNEGASDMKNFVQQYITSGNVVMFGNECLDDSQNF